MQSRVLFMGPDNKSIKLFELLHTGRDYYPLQAALVFVEQQLSRIKAAVTDDPGCRMAARGLYPGYVMSDKCPASCNSVSLVLNGCK